MSERARDRRPPDEVGYWAVTRRPLQILAFLLPLVVAYECGLAWLHRTEQGILTNKAHETLLLFFELVGIDITSGLYLGGVAIVVVLLIWHLLNRDPWRLDGGALALMAAEAFLLALPLLALGALLQRGLPATSPAAVQLAELDLWSKLSISIGAGLYEELLFRMMLIAIVHTLLVDLAGLRHLTGAAVAVLASAAAFTWYHPLEAPAGGLDPARLVFFLVAGLYFGLVYLVRGFGIVVAVHAIYDVVTIALLASPAGASQVP